MNFPKGGVPIWPPLFDLALAAPARVAHGPGASAAAVEAGAAWVPIALRRRGDRARGRCRLDPVRPDRRARRGAFRGHLSGAHPVDAVRPHGPARGGIGDRPPRALGLSSEPRVARCAPRPDDEEPRSPHGARPRARRADVAGRDLLGRPLRARDLSRDAAPRPRRSVDSGGGPRPARRSDRGRDGRLARPDPPAVHVRLVRFLPAPLSRGARGGHAPPRDARRGGAGSAPAGGARPAARSPRPRRRRGPPVRGRPRAGARARHGIRPREDGARRPARGATSRIPPGGSTGSSRRGRSWPTAPPSRSASFPPPSSSRPWSSRSGRPARVAVRIARGTSPSPSGARSRSSSPSRSA